MVRSMAIWSLGVLFCAVSSAAEPASIEQAIEPTQWLVVEHPGAGRRQPFLADRITAAIVSGTWRPPAEGQQLEAADGKQHAWQSVVSEPGKALEHPALKGGWAYTCVHVERPRRALLRAVGQSVVYVNGVPRVQNHYRYNWVLIPVLLQAGDNHLLFRCKRGTLRVVLEPVTHDVMINMADATLPEALAGTSRELLAGIVFLNTTTHPIDLRDLPAEGQPPAVEIEPCRLPALSIMKVPVRLPAVAARGERIAYRVAGCEAGNGRPSRQEVVFEIPVRRADEYRKLTFRSAIDDSVQYYCLRPPRGPQLAEPPGLMMYLHGAGDEASNYRDVYYPKPWLAFVHPTNRRPFGFDWEDWGRLDALEVFELALRSVKPDPSRIYLGGHSMGGHGVWQIAAHFPDRFAAIGPGASWPDFWSYAGAISYDDPTPVQALLDRCANPSRTKLMLRNYGQLGVYIIHGDADQVVPFELGKGMYDAIREFHSDVTLHVDPGMGHVYDTTPELGRDCFDKLELFEFFQRHARPPAPRVVEFVTTCPGINGTCHWVTIVQQQRQLAPSRVRLQVDPGRRVLLGQTDNVRRLRLDPRRLLVAGPLTVELDGGKLEVAYRGGPIDLLHDEAGWRSAEPAPSSEKGPHRYGLFKSVFSNHVLLVVGTQGTEAENAWALAKARYDSETFWYRGNGTLRIVLDRDFDPTSNPDRNVVLYGNADTNSAYAGLLAAAPLQVRRGVITAGDRELRGDDLACLMIYPRPGSERACVGLVGGTGVKGLRATDRLPYFVSGIAYPDWIVFSADVWRRGDAAVLGAGLFGIDWSLAAGDSAWAEH